VNGNATLRYLAHATPDLDEARAAVNDIVNDGHRASQIIRSIRVMFKKNTREKFCLDVNALIREVLALSSSELQNQQIVVRTELQQQLPNVIADHLQLHQVLLNLITNAIEAMNPVARNERHLLIRSCRHERDGVVIMVEDSGVGIDLKNKDRIFDAFFTTKSNRTGMGLAICRLFVEAHGGRLWASPRLPRGANFHVILPHDRTTATYESRSAPAACAHNPPT
jgi:signal transduction histidine kinase